MKPHDKYSSSAILKLLHVRYGLNQLGIKKLLKINTRRYNILLKGADNMNHIEGKNIESAFIELGGRFYYDK